MSAFKRQKMSQCPPKTETPTAAAVEVVRQMPDTGTEKCVCCGCDTGVPFNMPISERKYYEAGSGQLCGNCYIRLYIYPEESYSPMQDDEMNQLMSLFRNGEEDGK